MLQIHFSRQAGGASECVAGLFGVGAALGGPAGIAGASGATASGGASVKTLRTKPGGTIAVKIARSPDCSTFRLLKNVFTSASVP